MSKKFLLIFSLALVAVFILGACERSAVSPESTPGGDAGGLSTVSLPDAYKTQTTSGAYTALALTMQPGAPVVPGGTPTNTRYWDPTTTPTTSGLLPTLTGTVAVIVPTPTPGHPSTYTLQEGEYPYCIARRFNVDQSELLSLNNLTETQIIQPGFILNIPSTGNPFVGARTLIPHPTTYTVQMNETIYKIACAFGDVDPLYMAAYNSLVSPFTLTSGTVLNVP